MPSPETFNSSDTWVCPAGVTEVLVECFGAGGSGAWAGASSHGGGGGGFSSKIISVVPGTPYDFVVGVGGEPEADGGDTYFIDISTVLAKGGLTGTSGGYGGAAGSGVGDVRYSGGDGFNDGFEIRGGGSSAGPESDGTDSTDILGAIAPAGGGNGGNGAEDSDPGSPGSAPGGGGGGTFLGTPGNGAAGRIVLTYEESASTPGSAGSSFPMTFTW